MAASAEEPVVAGSILERAEKDAETLDWLSIPADQRIIDDKTLEWVTDVPGLFGTDDELECEEKENMEPEPKRTKLKNCSPVANVKDKHFVDLGLPAVRRDTYLQTHHNSFVRFGLLLIMR